MPKKKYCSTVPKIILNTVFTHPKSLGIKVKEEEKVFF